MNTQELNEFFKKKEEFEVHSAILEERMKSYLSINRNISKLDDVSVSYYENNGENVYVSFILNEYCDHEEQVGCSVPKIILTMADTEFDDYLEKEMILAELDRKRERIKYLNQLLFTHAAVVDKSEKMITEYRNKNEKILEEIKQLEAELGE